MKVGDGVRFLLTERLAPHTPPLFVNRGRLAAKARRDLFIVLPTRVHSQNGRLSRAKPSFDTIRIDSRRDEIKLGIGGPDRLGREDIVEQADELKRFTRFGDIRDAELQQRDGAGAAGPAADTKYRNLAQPLADERHE